MALFGAEPLTDADGQTEAERQIAAHVKQKVEESRSSANRVAHESIWMTNIAALLGYDGIAFDSRTRTFQPINQLSGALKKSRIHVNKILPTVQNRLARLCKNPPKYDVRPESDSTDDREAARLGLQILAYEWDTLSLDEKRILLYMWVQQTGHAYVGVCWDPTLGKFMPDLDGSGPGFEGDVRADIISPFEMFPDPTAKSFEEVLRSWIIRAKVRKLDYFKSHYPEKGHLVKPEDAWLLSAQYEQRINSINSKGGGQTATQEMLKDSAIELVKYEARSLKYPNGRMIVVANGILLEDKELPVGEIPFSKFDDVAVGGKYYSEAIVTHLRPLQEQFNQVIRRRTDWTNKLLAGKYKAARGAGLSQETLNDQSGEVVYFNPIPGAPNGPEPLQIPMIPQWAYAEEEKLELMFNEISGISEPSKGNAPSAQIPAIGMQLLIEQNDTRIGVVTEQHERAWARVGSLILKYVEKYWTMPRKLKIAGKSLEYTVKEVTGAELKGNTDVIVIRGSTLPGSKSLRRQEILNAFQQGLLGPPQDPKVIEKVLGMIEFGDVQGLWEDFGLDMSQINRGIKKLEQGVPVQVNEKDNNALWILELNRYRKAEKFEQLPPQVQNLFEQTIQLCTDNIVRMNTPPPAPQMPGMPGEPMPPEAPGQEPPPPAAA